MLKRSPPRPDSIKAKAPFSKRTNIPPWISKTTRQFPSSSSPREEDRQRNQYNQPNKEKKGESAEVRVIKMISGGATDGDSNRARKAWSRVESLGIGSRERAEGPTISFGSKDLEDVATPHNDALVIHARMANHEVRRIFVDSGSSVNVIFQEAFDQMSTKDTGWSRSKRLFTDSPGTPCTPWGK